MEKTCPRCGETKPLRGFSRDPSKADGVRRTCKSCDAAATGKSRARARSRRLREEREKREKRERAREAEREHRLERPPPQAPPGRTCAEPSCSAILSRYTQGDRCTLHEAEPFDPDLLDRVARGAAQRRGRAEPRTIVGGA